MNLGLEDPIQYVEDDGTKVSWESVKKHVSSVTEEWKVAQQQ